MASKLNVMLSSTSFDLPEHRRLAIDAIERAGCSPVAMEHGSATAGVTAIPYSLKLVDKADVYVGIFGARYGYVVEDSLLNPKQWSVTEHEYRHALKRGMPVLIYLMADNHPVPLKDTERDPRKLVKIDALKEELGKNHVAGFFDSPEMLRTLILQSLTDLKPQETEKTTEAVVPEPPALYAVPAYTLTNEFVGRKKELEELDDWAASSDTVYVVEAIGGMGKSALTWEWTRTASFEGRIWYSLYESTASMQTFLRHALAYIKREEPPKGMDAYEMAQELLVLLQARPHLIVLDGFERILAAYHQKSDDLRQCVNPKDGDLIRKLVSCGKSKILISSRLMPDALEDRGSHEPIQGVRHRNLHGLLPGDALDLARATGVKGSSEKILEFGKKFDYHALLMRLVCGLVNGYRDAPGDFDKWLADPRSGGYLASLRNEDQHTHILKFAFDGLEERQRQLLSRIAAMDDAAQYETVKALSSFPEAAELNKALENLEERGLLQWDRETNAYDAHPVVRAYAVEQLGEPDRVGAYNAIRDHFAALPPEKLDQATELAQLKNSIQVFRALVGAERLQEAARFYWGDLAVALRTSVCAYGTIRELMRLLLDCVLADPIEVLGAPEWAYLANELAIALQSLGKRLEARALLSETLRVYLSEKDWASVSAVVLNLVSGFGLSAQERALRISIELSAATDESERAAFATPHLAGNDVFCGRYAEARKLLANFRKYSIPARTLYRPGYAERVEATLAFYVGTLTSKLLEDGESVAREAHSTEELPVFASLRAQWELEQENSQAPQKALDAAEREIVILRKTGEWKSGPFAMRAIALARLNRPADARQSLQEASGGLDYSLYASQTYIALDEPERARESIREAYRLAWGDGPPYAFHWYLERCREILKQLGEPEPPLPPFDPAKVEKLPYEDEILAAIEKLKREKEKKKS